ncbi:MAG: hypothetical protein H0V93_00355 [Euzebyales bacterium]|jgi:folate-binding protein YgfZ|nr:hypothetical protein [Euzebyales bacterium]
MLLFDETAFVRRPVGVVRVTGSDRLGYLHTLLSQRLDDAVPGAVTDFLYLDAKGNAQAAGRAVVHAEAVLLVTPPEVAGELAANLEKFKFLMDVEAADVSGDWALASIRGPGAADAPGARREAMTAAPHGDGLVVRDRSGGADLLGRTAWVEERLPGLGLPEAGLADWETWRIGHGEPGWATEIATGRRAQELGLLPTHVHLRKGCYPGQESIAKIYNLGRPRRALAVVELDGAVAPGARLEAGGKAGEITSTAPMGDGAVALALLPVDRATGEVLGDGTVTGDGVSGHVLRRVGAGVAQPGAQ